MGGVSRRAVLAAGVGMVVGLGLAMQIPVYATTPAIRSRADWASGRTATENILAEDVRFLIIHHSASPNTQTPGSIPGRLRSFFDYHTQTKGWPDVAYNFFVDPFGEIWEGRTGSLAGSVRGDATGGSQGYAQLCCFVGDHSTTPPTTAAMTAMTQLIAWLAHRHDIDLAAGESIEFTSRGSNKWPAGTTVQTGPVVGHRDMSHTTCPGDALYSLVRTTLLSGAQALMGVRPTTAGPTQTPTSATPTAGTTPTPTTLPSPSVQPGATHQPVANQASGRPTPDAASTDVALPDRISELAVPVAVGAGMLGVGAIASGIVLAHKDR